MKVSSIFVICLVFVLAESSVPATQYLLTPSPHQYQYGTPSTQYGAPNDYTITLVPTEQYGTPNLQYNYQVGVPNSQYGATSGNAISENYLTTGASASQYGVPQTSKNHFTPSTNQNSKSKYAISNNVYSTSIKSRPQYDNIHKSYLASSTEGNYLDKYEANDEPANYGFKYYVQDTEGNDFGHEEDRQGDVANGRYHVLLPDGKRQTVEYTADAGGYKPTISYEQVGSGYADNGYQQGNIKHGGYSR